VSEISKPAAELIEGLLKQYKLRLTSLIPEFETCFQEIKADEGTLWLFNLKKELIPVWNSGSNAAEFVGSYAQSLETGLISVVFLTGQCFCDNEVYLNQKQDATLDRKLKATTSAMIAVPFWIQDTICGVVSCVRLKRSPLKSDLPAAFSASDLMKVMQMVSGMSSIEYTAR